MEKKKLLHLSASHDPARGHGKQASGRKGRVTQPVCDEIRDLPPDHITALLRGMPDLDPPEDLLPSVMGAVRNIRRPWWYRLYLWANAPKSIVFTPLHLVPALMVLLLVISSVSLHHLMVGNRDMKPFMVQGENRMPVMLSLNMPDAQSVEVIGSFNNWQGPEFQMKKSDREGLWTLTLWLPEGRYEYAFLVDGRKIVTDPMANLFQDDGFGNRNSVLFVGNFDGERA